MTCADFFHVDVFANGPLSGNGLTVFTHADAWSAATMLRLTQEMKQFESIFLSEVCGAGARARVFTVEEELPFAGHPVLGAAAVLHRAQAPTAEECAWVLRLASGDVPVTTRKLGSRYLAQMDQGMPVFGDAPSTGQLLPILDRLGLSPADLVDGLVPRVVSTGLPYLIVPVRADVLARTAINGADLETLLAAIAAKFVLVLDVAGRELRTWDNLGRVEDVATGSAAGPVAAYLFGLGLADPAQPLEIAQGRYAGRPSTIVARQDTTGKLLVSGEVWAVAQGNLDPAVIAQWR